MIWFSCHKYAALDVGGVDYVFDACAGPFGGDCLRADYLNLNSSVGLFSDAAFAA